MTPEEIEEQYRERVGLPLEGDGYQARGGRAILEGLRRVDAIPRTDPFWHNTNLRTTIHKVSYLIDRLAMQDPDDQLRHWIQIGLDVWQCDLGWDPWRALHAAGELNVVWILDAAESVYRDSGQDVADHLLRLIDELGLRDAALATLHLRAHAADHGVDRWTARLLGALA